MNIVYEKRTEKNLNEALNSLKENLQKNEFGVLWELNFKDRLEENGLSLKDDFIVLEVCNPKQAKEVLEKNIHIGYVLPCKMVVRNEGDNVYIGMTRPKGLIDLFEDDDLKSVAQKVEDTLQKAIEESL